MAFEVYKDKAGKWRFRLKAGNGEIIVFSEGYESKQSCLYGLELVIKASHDTEIRFIEE